MCFGVGSISHERGSAVHLSSFNEAPMKFIPYMRGIGLAALLALLMKNGFSAVDPVISARAFEPCAACHSIRAGENLTGPSLAHVWGQKAGTVKGFLQNKARR
jgi:hypothetical protein